MQMMNPEKTYIAIDLKSFYASVECSVRSLDALSSNLVVADSTRTDKTICLAVTPSLKAYGIPGRVRLFDVIRKVKEINANRLRNAIRLERSPADRTVHITSPAFPQTRGNWRRIRRWNWAISLLRPG